MKIKIEGDILKERGSLAWLFASRMGVEQAIRNKEILEALPNRVDDEGNLFFELAEGVQGCLPFDKLGVKADKLISAAVRVGKPTCFRIVGVECINEVMFLQLDRKGLQLEVIEELKHIEVGTVLRGKVASTAVKWGYIDIGYGVTALMYITDCAIAHYSNCQFILERGEEVRVAYLGYCEDTLFRVSMKEVMGTWQENLNLLNLQQGEIVKGRVVNIKGDGVFVELTPNLLGLMDMQEGLRLGDLLEVKVCKIREDTMKLKLLFLRLIGSNLYAVPKHFLYEVGDMVTERYYSPVGSAKKVMYRLVDVNERGTKSKELSTFSMTKKGRLNGTE